MNTMARPDNWRGSDLRTRSEVVNYLKQHGGAVVSSSGLAAGQMRDALGKGRALGQLLGEMEADGMIERDVRGRRTFSIRLLDDWSLGDDTTVDLTGTQPAVSQADGAPSIPGDVDLTALAEALLGVVLRKATATVDSGVLDRLRTALAEAKQDYSELRSRCELETQRADAAEEQVRILSHNIEQIKREIDKPRRGGGGVPIAERISASERRLLDNLMREVPKG